MCSTRLAAAPHGEDLREQLVDGLPARNAPEPGRLRTELGVGERYNLHLTLTNALSQWTNPPQLALVLLGMILEEANLASLAGPLSSSNVAETVYPGASTRQDRYHLPITVGPAVSMPGLPRQGKSVGYDAAVRKQRNTGQQAARHGLWGWERFPWLAFLGRLASRRSMMRRSPAYPRGLQ
jgi:hypothetical protein